MSAFYLTSANPNTGCSATHIWSPATNRNALGKWQVIGTGDFTTSGYAVVDDFGNLVKVPA